MLALRWGTGDELIIAACSINPSYDGAVFDGSYPITARTIYEQLMANSPPISWEIHYQDFTTAHGIQPLNTYTSRFIEDYNFTQFYHQVANNVRSIVPLVGDT